MTALLQCRHVTKVFSRGLLDQARTVAVDDFSLSIESKPPTITAVVGQSGSGKTTLARLLLGLETPTRGEVLFDGKNLRTLNGGERRAFLRSVQAVFQDPFQVYNPFYVVDHVLTTPIAKFGLARTRSERDALINEVLGAVGLQREDTLGRWPHQLSGGQRQRLMVARALLLKPRLIVADEPVSMIDASLRATVLGNLLQLNRQFGISVVYITHDLTTAYQISDNIIVMYAGSAMEVGEVELVIQNPQHPYTRLLISSIPQPDPALRWGADGLEVASGLKPSAAGCCKFLARCPHATQQCAQAAPPLYWVDKRRLVACYLFRDRPAVAAADMGAIFARSDGALSHYVGNGSSSRINAAALRTDE